MKRPRPADLIWIAIPVTAVVHNTWAAATGREQLSEAMDRYRGAAPVVTQAVIALTAAHLMRSIPSWCDPWGGVNRLIRMNHSVMNRSVLVGLVGAAGLYVLLGRAEDTMVDPGD